MPILEKYMTPLPTPGMEKLLVTHFGKQSKEWFENGAVIIGGCCRTTRIIPRDTELGAWETWRDITVNGSIKFNQNPRGSLLRVLIGSRRSWFYSIEIEFWLRLIKVKWFCEVIIRAKGSCLAVAII